MARRRADEREMESFRIAPIEQSAYDGKIFAESYLKKMERQEEGTVQAIAKSLQVGFKQAHREREEEYETLVLGETQEATLERVRRELEAKQAQYDSLLRAMEDAPPAVL